LEISKGQTPPHPRLLSLVACLAKKQASRLTELHHQVRLATLRAASCPLRTAGDRFDLRVQTAATHSSGAAHGTMRAIAAKNSRLRVRFVSIHANCRNHSCAQWIKTSHNSLMMTLGA